MNNFFLFIFEHVVRSSQISVVIFIQTDVGIGNHFIYVHFVYVSLRVLLKKKQEEIYFSYQMLKCVIFPYQYGFFYNAFYIFTHAMWFSF